MIVNPAREPEISDLADFLNHCGAKIYGAGESTIVIDGVSKLHPCEHTIIPDRILASTYMSLGAVCSDELTVKNINKEYPKVNILGYSDGYVDNKDDIFKRIKNISPDIVLVALGVPKQELLIAKHYDSFSKGIFVGVGGTFDVISGTKKRAPQIIQKLNIEWLYRIIGNKERIKRFYDSNVKFIFKLRKLVNEEI